MSRRTTGSRIALALVSTSALAATALIGSPVSGADAATGRTAQPHVAADLSAGHQTPAVYGAPRTRVGSVPGGLSAHAVTPQVTYTCQTSTPEGCFSPADIRHAYGIDQLTGDGAGQTIAIVDAFSPPSVASDLAAFSQTFGLPAADLQIVAPNGTTPWNPNDDNQVGWSGEIALDVEWAHAIAPAAHLILVEAKTNDDKAIIKAERYALQKSGADILTQSYGENEQCQPTEITKKSHGLYRRAAAAGISVFASSGDQGSAVPSCDGSTYVKGVALPAADPTVTSVGGTLLSASPGGIYSSETSWNEPSYNSATGGGISTLFKAPAYQSRDVTGSTQRTIPDVAYNAGINTGVLTVWSNSGQGANLVFRFGGTSAGSPQWAGLAALANQAAGQRLGQLNASLYALAGDPSSYASDFNDVTTGDNTYHGVSQTIPGFAAGTGYDLATGLGSPQAENLVPALAGVTAAR